MTAVPLTDQQLTAIRAQLGDVKPATNDLIVSLAESVQDRRTHEHPTGNEDWFCNNLSGWAGDRTAVVLRRLLDAEAELDRVRAELATLSRITAEHITASIAIGSKADAESAAVSLEEQLDIHDIDLAAEYAALDATAQPSA